MYTGAVVRLRSFALVLVLCCVATPLMSVVCEMDCDRPPATSTCHTSTDSPDGPIVRGAQHGCDHDHASASPALLTSASPRDSIGTFAAVPVPAFAGASIPDAGMATAAMHGLPGPSGRSTSSQITILRI